MKQGLNSCPLIATAVGAIIIVAALMIYPYIGMADNGDFYRSINGQGIYKLDRYADDQYFQYFSRKYGMYQYFNESEKSLLSVHNLYIQAAKFLDKVFTSDDEIFDIRFLAAIYLIQLLIGIYLLFDYITWKKPKLQKIWISAIGIFMFADTAYTAYFNSFYAEGIAYVTFLTLTACALLMTQKRYSPYLLLVLILINGVILIFTKQQNATVGAILFLLCIFIAFGFSIEKTGFKEIAVVGAILMVISGTLIYLSISDNFVAMNQYHAMTRGAMMTGENPEETLEQFGIDKQYSVLERSIYFERYPAVDVESNVMKEEFYNKYGVISLSAYYLTHPNELMLILNIAANNAYMIRPEMQGNFERSAGHIPGEKTEFFTLYSNFKKNIIPNTVGFSIIWILVVGALCFKDIKKLMIVFCTILIGLIQVGTSIIGAGDADIAKHIFLYNVAFDLVSFVCCAPIIASWLEQVIMAIASIFRKKKIATLTCLICLLCIGSSSNALAAEETKEEKTVQIMIVYKQGEDFGFIADLVESLGMQAMLIEEQQYDELYLEGINYAITTSKYPLEDFRDKKIKTLCLGTKFNEVEGINFATYVNKSAEYLHTDYKDRGWFEEELTVIDRVNGTQIGEIKIGDKLKVPFAAMGQDGNYYLPYYKQERVSLVLLGEVLQTMVGMKEEGELYFILDEVYVFSELEKICGWADILYENGIPYLVNVMPIYENLNYPAFLRYTQMLRYLQKQGGTVIINEPLVIEKETEKEPIADKMERFQTALEQEKIHYKNFNYMPYYFEYDSIASIKGSEKNFERLPFHSMFGINVAQTDEEFRDLIQKINDMWFSFSDYREEFTDSTYLYYEENIEKDFEYREKEETTFTLFFSATDKILLVVVGSSLIVFFLLLLIGKKWYRKKFYRSGD